MKNFRKSLLLAAVAALLGAGEAEAADGYVEVQGQIVSGTCSVTATGPTITGSGGNYTLALPKIAASSLAGSGGWAGIVPFAINVTCTGLSNISNAVTYFEPYVLVNADGHLGTNLSGIELYLKTANEGDINFNEAPGSQGVQSVPIANGTGITQNFVAGYANPSGATVPTGQVTSFFAFSIVYS